VFLTAENRRVLRKEALRFISSALLCAFFAALCG